MGVIYTTEQFGNPGVDYEFSPGERGCAHSHYRMWQHAAKADGPTLILEDDVQFIFERNCGGMSNGSTFTARLELGMKEATKKEADVLYLGWSGHRDGNYKHHKSARGRKNPVIRKAEYVWTTSWHGRPGRTGSALGCSWMRAMTTRPGRVAS